jgi:predicted metal-dependent enzyme (double-stranded beta helix superfamily)
VTIRQLDLTDNDWWRQYAHFDASRHYTRNLVATDGTTFTLLLLCWNPGRESPIHNHPCKGCWMRVAEGCVQEQRYVENEKFANADSILDDESRLRRISSVTYHGKSVLFLSSLVVFIMVI